MVALETRFFVDAHVHLKGPGALDSVRSAGIAAVRDAGFSQNAERPGCKLQKPQEPAVVTCCWALYREGGYGSRFGVSVATRDEIRTELSKLKKAGADIIKVMASGIVSFSNPGTVTSGGFGCDDLRFIVDQARESGLGVMAHANAEPAIMAAAGSGVRSIEHGFFMTGRALELMAANGVFWIPTVGALVRSAQTAAKARLFVRELINAHLASIKRAYDMGVPLAIGSDCILPDANYRQAYEAELAFFEQAGIERSGVLTIAAEGGARLLGISPREQREENEECPPSGRRSW